MPAHPKNKRNKELLKKRRQGWSFRELAKFYNITVRAAWEICQRWGVELSTGNKKG